MNEGIIINGNGKIEADQLVVGKGSKGEKRIYAENKENINDIVQIDKQFEDIASALLKNQESLNNIAELMEKVFSIRSDLHGKNPNKDAIGEKINMLVSCVSSATNLVTKLNVLREAIFAIL